MSKRHIYKSKSHICYRFLGIHKNPSRKFFINPSCPNHPKIFDCNKKWLIFISTLFCGALERFQLNDGTPPFFFCYSQISLIFSTDLWQICIFVLLDPWLFLKVINKVNIRVFMQTQVISYYWLTPVHKTLGVISY